MITLTDYTTYAEIRAVLGVSVYELPDETLALPSYTRGLQTRLHSTAGIFGATTGSLIDIFEVLSADPAPTVDEEQMLFLIQQFATYVVAEACLPGLSLLAMKSESDGEATQTRFSAEATFKDVALQVRQQLNSLAAQVDRALGADPDTLTLFGVATPSIDRVTGESA